MSNSRTWARRAGARASRLRALPKAACIALLPLLLSGCEMALFSPKGDIGVQTKNLILIASGLMLLVVIPVILLTLYFGWRYRETNTRARYEPKWSHSTSIEVVVWTIPCIIVAILAVLIWKTTHELDPYKPLQSEVAPLRIEVVALDWKWLFIYPDYGIATINQLPVPVGTPLEFKLTAQSMMNSFFIPQLGTQIYAMAGMQTRLHLIADEPGDFPGLSAAYSGPGFSDMHFLTHATSRAEFDTWVKQAQNAPQKLDAAAYERLAQPSGRMEPAVYSQVQPALFDSIVNLYMHSHGAPRSTAKQLALTQSLEQAIASELCSAN